MSEVRTQKELDAALKRGDAWIDLRGDGVFTVTAYGSSTVRACGSSTVRAYDSSTVTAYDSSTVRAYGSSTVTASAKVAVHDHGPSTKCRGGVIIPITPLTTIEDFCEYWGIPIKRGVAVMFKAVEADWKGGTKRDGISYEPGSKPAAPDWIALPTCGNGLHLVPLPWMGDQYLNGPAAHYVSCAFKVADAVVIDRNKIKVPRLVRPTVEVSADGDAL